MRVCDGEILSLCGPHLGAQHDPSVTGLCWKQIMVLLEKSFGLWRCFPCTSRIDEEIRVRVTGRRTQKHSVAGGGG